MGGKDEVSRFTLENEKNKRQSMVVEPSSFKKSARQYNSVLVGGHRSGRDKDQKVVEGQRYSLTVQKTVSEKQQTEESCNISL